MVPEYCGDDALVVARTREGIALAKSLGYPFRETIGAARCAWVQGRRGDAAQAQAALATLDEAIQQLEAMGAGHWRGQFLTWRARLLLRCGDNGAAQLAVAQALGHTVQTGFALMANDALLAEGEVLLAHGGEQRALAGAAFQTAFDAAQAQGARSWQLRAAIPLAQLAAEDAGPGSARRILQPLLDRFDQGHDTADLKHAASLLARWH